MRYAKSYSILDHQFLHGRYIHKLSHGALALYLFLVLVGDREGKSFYSERSIMSVLRFSSLEFSKALDELLSFKLVDYRRPNFWVQNFCHESPRDRGSLSQSVVKRDHLVKKTFSTPKKLVAQFLRQMEEKNARNKDSS